MVDKLLKLFRANLLGVAIALGFCSFVYEEFINYSPHFTLTKYFGILALTIAIYYRFKYDLIKQNKIGKD